MNCFKLFIFVFSFELSDSIRSLTSIYWFSWQFLNEINKAVTAGGLTGVQRVLEFFMGAARWGLRRRTLVGNVLLMV